MNKTYLLLLTILLSCQVAKVPTSSDPTRGLCKHPYFEMDGHEITKSELDKIDPQQIASITVTGKKSARKTLGKKARDGAVFIETTAFANRLFHHVDSLITQVLKYEYPKTSESTLVRNPEPRILLDGTPVKKEDLKKVSMDNIATIELIEAGSKSMAIFGTMGENGAIIITQKGFIDPAKND